MALSAISLFVCCPRFLLNDESWLLTAIIRKQLFVDERGRFHPKMAFFLRPVRGPQAHPLGAGSRKP
jgi:hypothetical protein